MITLLTGENKFELNRVLAQIKRDFDGRVELIDGEKLNLANLPDIFMGISLFSEKRLIVINGLSDNKIIWNDIGDWLDKISDDIHLVLIETKIDKRTSTYKKLKKSVHIEDFPALTDKDTYKVEKWVGEEAARLKLTMNNKSIQTLVRRIGNDQWQLFFALEKLSLLNKPVTDEIIYELIPANPIENVFDLFVAATNGNMEKLAELLDSLEQTEDAHRLLGLLISQAFQLTAVSSASREDNVAKDFGIHPYAVQKTESIVHKIGKSGVVKIVNILSNADKDMKSSGNDPWMILENALYKIASM